MLHIQNSAVEFEILASAVRRQARILGDHQRSLKEVLEAIERQDVSPGQIREQLTMVENGLKGLGREARLLG